MMIFAFVVSILTAMSCTILADLQNDFVTDFLNSYQENELMRKVFQMILDGAKENYFYKVQFDNAAGLGMPDPDAAANSIVGAIESVADILKPELFAKAVASTYEQFLEDYGVMTPANAAELSRAYLDSVLNAISSLPPTSTGEEYLNALSSGGINFLTPYNVLTPESAQAFIGNFYRQMANLRNNVAV